MGSPLLSPRRISVAPVFWLLWSNYFASNLLSTSLLVAWRSSNLAASGFVRHHRGDGKRRSRMPASSQLAVHWLTPKEISHESDSIFEGERADARRSQSPSPRGEEGSRAGAPYRNSRLCA